MGDINVVVTGGDIVAEAFKKFGKQAEKAIANATELNALDIAGFAKRQAPVDKGRLRQDIISEKINPLSYQVSALAPYSAYQEFGTGGLVEVPDVFRDQALQFKGAGIRKINMPPQPFMYPAYRRAVKQYPEDINDELEHLAKNFNNG